MSRYRALRLAAFLVLASVFVLTGLQCEDISLPFPRATATPLATATETPPPPAPTATDTPVSVSPAGKTPEPTATPPPTLTPHLVTTTGQVHHAITDQPISGTLITSSVGQSSSDDEGNFAIDATPLDRIVVSAEGYETKEIIPRADFAVTVRLAPDPRNTFALLHLFEKQREYGRQYDLLHPDSQQLFSQDEYIRFKEQTRDFEIVETSYGQATMLDTWTFRDRTYQNVAEVPIHMVIRRGEAQETKDWKDHLVQVDGIWRWFSAPLEFPTATPQPTETLTPTATFQAGGYPIGTRLEVVVRGDGLNIRYGPGTQFNVITRVAPGTIVIALGGAQLVGTAPWYEVQVAVTGIRGWAHGGYLRPAPPVTGPTATATPTLSPTPLPGGFMPGTRVQVVNAPEGLNIRYGPDTSYGVITKTPQGSILVIRQGPTWVGASPWYEVLEEATGIIGWAHGGFMQPLPITGTPTATPVVTPATGYFSLAWVPGCDPSRIEVALLLPEQSRCGPGVLTRSLSWLEAELTALGVVEPAEYLQAAAVGQCVTCGIVVRSAGGAIVGWIRIGGGEPGAVWRTIATPPGTQVGPRCLLRRDFAWECN